MPELLAWPFPLPERFTEALGYERAVEAFENPALRARVAELLRLHGLYYEAPAPANWTTGPGSTTCTMVGRSAACTPGSSAPRTATMVADPSALPPPPRPAHHSSPPGGAPCLMTP